MEQRRAAPDTRLRVASSEFLLQIRNGDDKAKTGCGRSISHPDPGHHL
jgi:hypothetical protein